MALVNCSVLNRTSNKTVLPWSIMSVESGVTVQQFYDEKVVCKLPDELDLESAWSRKIKRLKLKCRYLLTQLFICLDPFCATIPAVGSTNCLGASMRFIPENCGVVSQSRNSTTQPNISIVRTLFSQSRKINVVPSQRFS